MKKRILVVDAGGNNVQVSSMAGCTLGGLRLWDEPKHTHRRRKAFVAVLSENSAEPSGCSVIVVEESTEPRATTDS